jgi:hypothetical protein
MAAEPDYEVRRARLLGDWRPTYPFTVRTLRDYVYTRSSVRAYCASWPTCPHCVELPLIDLAERYGPETPLDVVVRRLRCSVCESRKPPEVKIGHVPTPVSPQRHPSGGGA